jgi:predicted alpha/beta superfamily hydrolase
LLDGSADEDFIHIVGLVQFLTMIDTMPPSIIVGIANVDRKRDFTFPTTVAKDKKDYPTTGGSEKFISFIEKDLEPYIEQQYRINGSKRTIIGQSLGGLLATQVLLQKPDLFDNFIVVSPSLWWDNESLLQKARGLLNASAFHRTTVYVAVGDEEKVMEDDAKKLVEILQHPLSPELRVFYVSEPKENHLTILHNAVYNAIEKLELKKY